MIMLMATFAEGFNAFTGFLQWIAIMVMVSGLTVCAVTIIDGEHMNRIAPSLLTAGACLSSWLLLQVCKWPMPNPDFSVN